MIRLFIALQIPHPLRHILHSMGRGIPGARPVAEEQIHLTLRFIGEVEGSVFKDIGEHLQYVDFSPFAMRLKGVGYFPPRGNPRVIWAGVEPQKTIIRMRNSIEKQLIACGLNPENRKFMPHITLARLQHCPKKRLGKFLAGNAFFETDEFTIKDFHLYSSILSSNGAIHSLERSYCSLE